MTLDSQDGHLDKVLPSFDGMYFALVVDSVDQPTDLSNYCSWRLFNQEVVMVAALERQHDGGLARPRHVVAEE